MYNQPNPFCKFDFNTCPVTKDRRTLWQKFLDWAFPRLHTSIDIEDDGAKCQLTILHRRDGVYEVIDIQHTRTLT